MNRLSYIGARLVKTVLITIAVSAIVMSGAWKPGIAFEVLGTKLELQNLVREAVLIGVGIVVVAQFAFTYLPPMQAVFGTRDLSIGDGVAILGVGVALLVIVEVEKRLFALFGGRAGGQARPAR